MSQEPYIHPTCDVSPKATIGPGTKVWNWSQIREDAVIGADTIVGQMTYIGVGVRIGDRCRLMHKAGLDTGVLIGNDFENQSAKWFARIATTELSLCLFRVWMIAFNRRYIERTGKITGYAVEQWLHSNEVQRCTAECRLQLTVDRGRADAGDLVGGHGDADASAAHAQTQFGAAGRT